LDQEGYRIVAAIAQAHLNENIEHTGMTQKIYVTHLEQLINDQRRALVS
jgi:hypothetical protein